VSAGVAVRAAAAAQVFVEDPGAPVPSVEDRHHLFSVLRLRAGETVVASDGSGRWSLCRCTGADGALEPIGAVEEEPPPAVALTVAFAPVKGDRPEWVVQKLTELGIDRIVPLVTERTVVRWEGQRAARARARLSRVAREAAAQSRRVWLPEIDPVVTFLQFRTARHEDAGLALADLGGPPPTARTVTVAVGPEGGWSDRERASGLPVVGLAAGVLRAETAAVAAGVLLGGLRAGTVAAGESRSEVGES